MLYFLAICKNKFCAYRADGRPEYFGGNDYFEYEQSKMPEATARLVEEILSNNNLADKNELQFALIDVEKKVNPEATDAEIIKTVSDMQK